MTSVKIILSVLIALILVLVTVLAAGWLKALPVLALILFAVLLRSGSRRPDVTSQQTPPPLSPDELQQHIDDEKLAAISKFCSVFSHELRNPLASLKNIAYFFSKALKTDDERIKKMVEMMGTEVDKANTMITDLTDVSHLKRVNKLPSDIAGLVTTALSLITPDNTIQITSNLEKVEATADPDKFTKAVRNLVVNAVQAMPNGGSIEVALKKLNTACELTVKDTGAGMDAETLSHAFNPMFTTKTKALGLGLTFAREVARMHGGTIAITSEKDKGTTVTLSFPL